jgi:thioredoxin 1
MSTETRDAEKRWVATASSDRLSTVTGGTFDALVLKGSGPIAVEFMSYGCSHCRVLEPVIQRVAETLESKVKIFRVNTAVEEKLAQLYAVNGTPTLVMFLNGKEVGRAEGPSPEEASVLKAVSGPFES